MADRVGVRGGGGEQQRLAALLKKDPVVRFLWKRRTGFAAVLTLAAIVVFAFFARWNTLWLPHWIGDQSHYLALLAREACERGGDAVTWDEVVNSKTTLEFDLAGLTV